MKPSSYLSLFPTLFALGIVSERWLAYREARARAEQVAIEDKKLSPDPEITARSRRYNLLKAIREMEYKAHHDQQTLDVLLHQLQSDHPPRAVQFGMYTDEDDTTDNAIEGKFIASLLPHFRAAGFGYLAIAADTSLNVAYTTMTDLEAAYRTVHGDDWDDVEAPILKARQLGMKVVFYGESAARWGSRTAAEYFQFENLKRLIFDKDAGARAVILSPAGSAMRHTEQVDVDWLTGEKATVLARYLDGYLDGNFQSIGVWPNHGFTPFWLFDQHVYLQAERRDIERMERD